MFFYTSERVRADRNHNGNYVTIEITFCTDSGTTKLTSIKQGCELCNLFQGICNFLRQYIFNFDYSLL